MANHTGNEGQVKIGSSAVGELQSWSIDETVETADDTVIGDAWMTHKTIAKAWTGSCKGLWDETDTAQVAGSVGASVTVSFYPEGTGSGATYATGTATVEKLTRSGARAGLVEFDMTLKGNGALAWSTV